MNLAILLLLVITVSACQRSAASTQPDTPSPTPSPSTAPTNTIHTLVKPEGWTIPTLPKNRKLQAHTAKVGDRTVRIFSSENMMGMIRFKEPYDAFGLTTWGRLMSVQEFQTSDHKPYCYRLAAEHDWNIANEATGALMLLTILDTDGDGVFETLSGHGMCVTPDWVK